MKVATPPDPKVIAEKGIYLPPSQFKKTIIFDLDETLVHCVDDIENLPFDLPISVQFQAGERIDAGINVRPYVYDCLK
jgi:CTD small phosphatase-like protein 2